MTISLCFSCGADKYGALAPCSQCKATPTSEVDLVLSLVLSDHLATPAQLTHFAHEKRNHLKLSIPQSLFTKAREMLKDQQKMSLMGLPRSIPGPRNRPNLENAKAKDPTSIPKAKDSTDRSRPRVETALHRSPFHLLRATMRDDRRRIVELAELRALELDHDVCQKARADLTNPRTRLSVEMSWLPGVSPKRAEQLVESLSVNPMAVRNEPGLPTLAHANVMAAAFEAIGEGDTAEDVAEFIEEMANLVDELTVDEIVRDIDEDRAVSGFPEVRSTDQVEEELAERKRYYRKAIKEALDRLPASELVAAMTLVVDSATAGGEVHAPELVDELVDGYEVESQGFLQQESDNVQKLIKVVKEAAPQGEQVVKPLVTKLDKVARNWDKVAHPIQLSAKARGITHKPSAELAFSIRGLAIDLFNEHGLLGQAQHLTDLVGDIFSDMPEVTERIEEDASALDNIEKQRKKQEAAKAQWARDITYRAEIGILFKDVLSISPDGVSWKDRHFPLDAVTRIRWGGVSHSVNGIPSGTTYHLAFGDNRSEAVIELNKEVIFAAFTDRLWRGVGVRLLDGLLRALKEGREIRFGDAMLSDDGVALVKHKFLGSNETVRCHWSEVHIWSADGSFYIGSKSDKKAYVGLSYIHTPNTHVLEQAIRIAFKKPGLKRLSELLQ